MTAPYSSSRYAYEGTETTETSIVRTGGATDPAGQAQSRKIVTTANAQWLRPFRCEPWAIWNETVGEDVTVTVYGLAIGPLPNADDVWVETEFLGDASSTLGTIRTTTKVNVLATGAAVSSDSSVWSTPATPDPPMPAITGLLGWWDASVTASLTLSGTDILSVADQSGGGRTMNWVNAKPQYNATGFNSAKPAIVLGSSSALQVTGFPMGTGNTLTVWVVGTLGGSASDANARLMNYIAPSMSDWGSAGSWTIYRNVDSATRFQRNSTNANAAASVHPAPHRLIYTINSSGLITVYVDGVSSATATSGGNWITAGVAQIGREAASGAYWAGPVAEAGIATGYSDATLVAQLDAYLDAKWIFVPTIYTPFKLVATLSSPQPGQPGLIHVRPKIGKASATIYLDPKIELT